MLPKDIVNTIVNKYEEDKKNNKLFSQNELAKNRESFEKDFNIEQLKNKNGEELLEFLFLNKSKKNSVGYHMESGLLKESWYFGTYGGMQAPAMLNSNNFWVYRNPRKPKEPLEKLEDTEVIKLAELVKKVL